MERIPDSDVRRFEEQARDAASDSDAGGPVLMAAVSDVLASQNPTPGKDTPQADASRPDVAPADVVVHQRHAMARAVTLRDAADAPEGVRALWARAVERLAALRREAKDELLRVRRGAPKGSIMLREEIQAREVAVEIAGQPEERMEGDTPPAGDPLGMLEQPLPEAERR